MREIPTSVFMLNHWWKCTESTPQGTASLPVRMLRLRRNDDVNSISMVSLSAARHLWATGKIGVPDWTEVTNG